MEDVKIETTAKVEGGGELTIAAMNEYSYAEIGRKTYRFVRRCMRDPVLRAKIQARAAEIRAEEARRGETDCHSPQAGFAYEPAGEYPASNRPKGGS